MQILGWIFGWWGRAGALRSKQFFKAVSLASAFPLQCCLAVLRRGTSLLIQRCIVVARFSSFMRELLQAASMSRLMVSSELRFSFQQVTDESTRHNNLVPQCDLML